MADAADHDVRSDFQMISDYINSKIQKDRTKPRHDEISPEDAVLMHSALHIAFSLVSSMNRIATALERIADNTQNRGMMQ